MAAADPTGGNDEAVPPELIRAMATAAAAGIPLRDLETFDEWKTRMEAESPGEDLVITHQQMTKRKAVLFSFAPHQLQLVSEARQNGTLVRLQKEPAFLMRHVTEEAEQARQRALDEVKMLAETTMLNSLSVVGPACRPCSSFSHRDRPPQLYEAEEEGRAAAAQTAASSSS